MELVYTIPFFINKNIQDRTSELEMARECIESLSKCEYLDLIFYNQGGLTNEELADFLSEFDIKFKILGEGVNDGVPIARYSMLKYIKEKYPNVKYIAEMHLDMIFTPDWHKPLIEFLETTDEPCVSPQIVHYFNNGYYVWDEKIKGHIPVHFPSSLEERVKVLDSLRSDAIIEGFAYPVINKAEVMYSIPFYDVGFLVGRQGYEDDSILLGYNYYMGTKNNWVPKVCFRSCVCHKTLTQRFKVDNLNTEITKNLEGIKAQYGAYGQKELYRIFSYNKEFQQTYEEMILDKDAYNKPIKEYNPQY